MNTLDRRTLLKLSVSSFAFAIGSALAFGSEPQIGLKEFNQSNAKQLFDKLPHFDGAFVFDTNSLNACAVDFGHYFHKMPIGVLIPANAEDVRKMVAFAGEQKIQIAVRGSGGAAYGQTQILNGIVIDMSSLKKMSWVNSNTISAGPGAIWFDVAKFTNTHNKIPVVLPDTLYISVGGTLSAGGFGETSYNRGCQVDHVKELDVVTGSGVIIRCSDTFNSDLFNAVLTGMGQSAIIVDAKIEVMDSPAKVFTRTFKYIDHTHKYYLQDLKLFSLSESRGAIGSHLVRNPDGKTFTTVLEATYWSSETPNWLQEMKGETDGTVKTWSFFEYTNRNSQGYRDGVKSGAINFPHPYMSFFVAARKVEKVIDAILNTPSFNQGASKIALFPMISRSFKSPNQSLPSDDFCYHMRIYRIVRNGEGSVDHLAMLKSNYFEVLPFLLSNQATMYLPFTPPLNRTQMQQGYNSVVLNRLLSAKKKFDPMNVLNPDVGFFDLLK